ncbi:hypothetical protein A1O3_08897 [Capronia epimyces CBS 606.96]|uniref:Uncharacterized protein n=1 Tax=Capronia epimyces CBS 606.96 TaxID=1182542 RepID=W9XQ13_9EURO|nr:uncharacterized protein A1O3_08897 [Capronia epimyces CBS 606.96]EXJ79395.1 hypothetical protein A1O3_08897 [Capronia epimyces CBS 606.96]
MIPWSSFNSSELGHEWRIDLNEHNLAHFVDREGRSPLQERMNFPMLESAHERRFAVAQMGTQCSNFEAWHKARLEYALQTTKSRFTAHALEGSSPPNSPHVQDLPDLQLPSLALAPLPPLPPLEMEISDLPELESARAVSPPLPSKPSTTALTLDQLMNPEPLSPCLDNGPPNPSPTGHSAIIPDSSPEPVEEIVDPAALRRVFNRAVHFSLLDRQGRARRDIRQRISKTDLRTKSGHDDLGDGQNGLTGGQNDLDDEQNESEHEDDLCRVSRDPT